jgi:hypothetical protein
MSLTLISILFMFLALGFPLQIMFLYGHGFDEFEAVVDKLTWLNLLCIAGLATSSILAWKASPALRVFQPILLVLVAVNNFVVGYYATDYSALDTTFATLGFLVLNIPLIHAEVRELLRDPTLRWWLRAQRKRMALPVQIDGTRLASIKAETFDLSETGVFIQNERETGIGDVITLRLKFGTVHQFRCQGRVVRRSEPKGVYPAGVGVEFTNLSWRQRRELRRHLEL